MDPNSDGSLARSWVLRFVKREASFGNLSVSIGCFQNGHVKYILQRIYKESIRVPALRIKASFVGGL